VGTVWETVVGRGRGRTGLFLWTGHRHDRCGGTKCLNGVSIVQVYTSYPLLLVFIAPASRRVTGPAWVPSGAFFKESKVFISALHRQQVSSQNSLARSQHGTLITRTIQPSHRLPDQSPRRRSACHHLFYYYRGIFAPNPGICYISVVKKSSQLPCRHRFNKYPPAAQNQFNLNLLRYHHPNQCTVVLLNCILILA
jgi:hypothetical protein